MTTALKSKLAARPQKIYIVEDHPTFREGLVQILNTEADLKVCGMAGTADQALPGIARAQPDLVLVDISLPGKSGLDLIKELRSVNRSVKILVISMHDEALYAAKVLRSGGDGYIMKQEDPDEIVYAIHDVLEGRIYVSEEVMESHGGVVRKRQSDTESKPLDQLTDSELEILELIGRGKSSGEIALKLQLSKGAVAASRAQLREKLKLKDPQALTRYAVSWAEGSSL